MKTIYHYLLVCGEVCKDLYAFLRYTQKDISLYTHATFEVARDLWNDFLPEQKTEGSSITVIQKSVVEDESLLLYALLATPLLLLLGSIWFFIMMVFISV